MSNPFFIILIVAMGAIWILFIRPQKRRQQLQQQMLNKIEPGAEVLTAAGLYGTVVSVDEDEVKVEIADGVVVKIARRAIGAVIPPEVEEEEGAAEEAEPEPAEPVAAEATDDDAAPETPS